MKIIAIGDTHGRPHWMQILEEVSVNKNLDGFDKMVFVGDYFDTHENTTAQEQIDNFKAIIKLKDEFPDKIVLLIGNHDFHYLELAGEKYSGYQTKEAKKISKVLQDAVNRGKLQAAFEEDGVIYTHAGVTKTWATNNLSGSLTTGLAWKINGLFVRVPEVFRFTPGNNRDNSGDDITQSPIWVRPKSLIEDKIEGYKQVVGHTQQSSLVHAEGFSFIDCLGTSGEYLVMINGEKKNEKENNKI